MLPLLPLTHGIGSNKKPLTEGSDLTSPCSRSSFLIIATIYYLFIWETLIAYSEFR